MCRRSRILMAAATLAVVVGAGAVHARLVGHYRFLVPTRFGWDLAYCALLGVTGYAVGLPDKANSRGTALALAVPAVGAAAVVMSLIQFATGSQLLPRFVVAVSALALVPAYMACAGLSLRERAGRRSRERILVVAEPEDVQTLVQDLTERPEQVATVVASATLEAVQAPGSDRRPLVDLAAACLPTVLVMGRRAAADDGVVAQAAVLHERGIRVRTLSLFYEEWMGKLPLGELERVSLMFDIGELHRARYVRVKRLVDVVVATVGVVLTALAIPAVAITNFAANRGPLFFTQERVGKSGATFRIIKFRTCRPTAHEGDTPWTMDRDPRVTTGGSWLRRLHVDELPNFVNVLRGEMTLVGPRPEQPGYVTELSTKLPFYSLRHLVRPGLTGWAQVNYGYASDLAGALEKLQYDFYYLRHQGLAIDSRVLARSLRAILRGGR